MNNEKSGLMMGGANTKTPEPTMWKMIVVFDFPGTMLKFMFRDEAKMLAARELFEHSYNERTEIVFGDDCGAWCRVLRARVSAVCVSDISRESDGENDAQLITALKQADLARRAQSDSRLTPPKVMVPNQFGRG